MEHWVDRDFIYWDEEKSLEGNYERFLLYMLRLRPKGQEILNMSFALDAILVSLSIEPPNLWLS
jgi:hypothetical protein